MHSLISKVRRENIICTMDNVLANFSGPLHGTTPAAVIGTKNLRSFESSEHINKKSDGPYRGFGYLSLFSGPIDSATWNQRELL